MATPKLSKLELQIMEILWVRGASAIREVQEAFSEGKRPAYTTVQTLIYRLEAKKAVRRTRKIGNAHIFEPAVSKQTAKRRLLDEFIAVFGGMQPVMAQLIESGQLPLADVQEAEKTLREMAKKRREP